MSKMERLFDLHRMQLLSAWDSLVDSEKSQMLKMFDKMYENMQSMTFEEHMKHMSSMMDKKHDMSGCSCGEGEHGMACDCSEDGICNCGAGCTCAACN